ncbi:hypothetical protein [Methylobacterium sp. AMS5]|uniref:hypothetical protein n=1 Tax=Methylobacterium sp. AMS5 TaxID=925818 RepID=UPI00074F8437|nr:hypothetical protein [Methylobacterium sp. AMS5]AMB48302.1 hypothetical protein Y590_25375 [Methylobacterium sp. AMS5]
MTIKRQSRADGRTLTRSLTPEEAARIHADASYIDTPEQIEARRKEIEQRLTYTGLSARQRTLLEVELRVCHLPTPWQRKEARSAARRALHIERQEKGVHYPAIRRVKPQTDPSATRIYEKRTTESMARNAMIRAHPLYKRAAHYQYQNRLPQTYAATWERIQVMLKEQGAESADAT